MSRVFPGAEPQTIEEAFFALDAEDDRYLRVSDVPISDRDAQEFANKLRRNKALIRLWLHRNNLSPTGARFIFWEFRTNNRIKELSILGNDIGFHGAVALAEALKENTALKSLTLRHQGDLTDGLVAIADALKYNQTLTVLDVQHIPRKVLQELVRTLEVNTTLREIRVINSSLVSGQRVLKALSHNAELQQMAVAQAKESTEEIPWQRSKLMVIGAARVGKTSTVRSLLNEPFSPNMDSTVGIDLKEIKTMEKEGWQETDREEFASSIIYRKAFQNLGILKTSAKRPGFWRPRKLKHALKPVSFKSFGAMVKRKLGELRAEIQNQNEVTVDDHFQILENEFVLRQFPESLEADHKTGQPNESDRIFQAGVESNSIRMSIWDFGGQTVFYTLHHLFLTRYGIYLLVFDIRKMMDQVNETLEFMRFWINSVSLHAPDAKMVVVGTFFLSIAKHVKNMGEIDAMSKEVIKVFENSSVKYIPNGRISFFPIDNKSKYGVPLLKSAVETSIRGQDYVNRLVSLNWMRTLDSILEAKHNWVKLFKVKQIASKHGVHAANEVEEMLGLFHELGIVFYFNKSVELRELVTTSPEWLVRSMSQVIRDPSLHSFDRAKIEQAGLAADFATFSRHGLVSRDLLECFWQGEQVQFLLDLMRSLLLLSPWKFANSEESYLVPSMITTTEQVHEMKGAKCAFHFEYLPLGVFERFLCLCIDYASKDTNAARPYLEKDFARITFVQEEGGTVEISTLRLKDTICVYVEADEHAATILNMLLAMMKRLRGDIMGSNFAWTVEVEVASEMIPLEVAKAKALQPWFSARDMVHASANIEDFLEA